jgi:hypothetical protein
MSRGIGDRPSIGVIPKPLIQVFAVSELVHRAAAARSAVASCHNNKEGVVSDSGEVQMRESLVSSCASADQPIRILAVSATDGLIDYINGTDLAEALLSHEVHAFIGARQLFYRAAKGWHKDMGGSYRDDMALAVFELQQ